MLFTYDAINPEGARQKGTIEALSEKEVLDFLRKGKYTTLSVKKKSSASLLSFKNKVKSGDVVLFTRQLSSMVLTGLTLVESLTILKDQTNKPQMKKLINSLIENISEGKTFSDSLALHKDVFSEVYIALIRAAETSGLLDKVLVRLADNLEKSEDIKKKVKSALFYPLIIIIGVVLVILIMNVFVIPQLSALYTNLNLELPLTTRIVLAMSKFVKTMYPFMIIGVIGGIILINRFKKTEVGKKTLDSFKLKFPVLGQIFKLSTLDEVARTLSLLVASGTSILESLSITANVANNVWYRDSIVTASSAVEKGVPLSTAFSQNKFFPQVFSQMLKVGESTGKIDESLNKLAEYFERDLDIKVKNLTTSIEPIIIIVLGVTVAFLIISVITPIYGLISQVQ